MRVVLDVQSLQSASRWRGIGRYTRCMLKALHEQAPEHDYVLLFNAALHDSLAEAMREARVLMPTARCVAFEIPGPVAEHNPDNGLWRELAENLREAFIANLEPDVCHVFSLLEGYDEHVVTSIGRVTAPFAVTTTFYDLIPLLNPEDYLDSNPLFKTHYLRKLESLRRSDRLLAISHFSGGEAAANLDYPTAHICVGPLGPMQAHGQLRCGADRESALLREMSLTPGFVLYVGGSDSRKNLPRLVEAWGSLERALQQAHPLVFAGRMPELDEQHLRHLAGKHSQHPEQVRFLGQVSDEQLEVLYQSCCVFVFPSWHEGFGLPPLEAMVAGCAVIASNTSSLPEVVGLDEALFDPLNVADIADHLARALTDDAFRDRLIAHAAVQAPTFSWANAARAALEMWRSAVADRCATSAEAERGADDSWRDRYDARLAVTLDTLAVLLEDAPNEQLAQVLPALSEALAHNERVLQGLAYAESGLLSPWRIEGPFDSSYSLALVNREFARGLAASGVEVVLHSADGPGDIAPNPAFLVANPDLADWYAASASQPPASCAVLSRFMYPPRVEDMVSPHNALHCYGWEEGGFPQEWVAKFNRHLQSLTTMSQYVAKVLLDNGVAVPMASVGLGVDHWERVTPVADLELPEPLKGFVFLHISSCFPRKGIDVLLDACGQAFTAADDVSLLIKTFPNPHNEVHALLARAQDKHPGFPHVVVWEDDLTDAQMKALMGLGDALVAPSRGEGFGLPMAEAMLSGLAVVTTAYGGQMDFCSSANSWLVDYDFAPADTHFALPNSVWAEPKVEHLAEQLWAVRQAPPAERRERAQRGRALLLESFTWARVAARSIDFVRAQQLRTPTHTPRVAWVSSWNTRCGIAAYSKYLVEQLDLPTTVYASHLTPEDQLDVLIREADGANVRRCWHSGIGDDLVDLEAALAADAPDALVIQFNYGFFEFPALAGVIAAQKALGRTVVVMFHSTVDPPQLADRKLALLVELLAQCDRLLVHGVADLNRLKALGLVDNTAIVPHGILEWPAAGANRERWQPSQQRPLHLLSYGFFLPHKGLRELVEAMALLVAAGQPVRLTMMNAEYPHESSRQAIAEVRALVAERGLEGIVAIDTHFYPDHESLQMLAAADLVVFPYQDTGESSSAAVRHAIASGVPVAVTPLEIFRDVNQAVARLDGCTPQALAEGIERLLAIDVDAWLAWRSAANRWRVAHHHTVVAARLSSLLRALYPVGS